MGNVKRVLVTPIGVGVGAGLVIGVWMGLARLGWSLGSPPAPAVHGPLLVLGVLGALIGLERAVALGRSWAWIAPWAPAVALVAMLAGAPREVSGTLLILGGIALVAIFVTAGRGRSELHLVVMGIGAGAAVLAALGWVTGRTIPELVPLLGAFLVITIAGERLELARFTVDRAARWWFALSIAALGIGAVASRNSDTGGSRLAGVGLVGLALWLGRYDVARRTIRMRGSARFMAAALLTGYGWIAVTGVLWVTRSLQPGLVGYDAAVHALFLGFVMSMIFGHAIIVVPSLTGLAFPWTPSLWSPLALLHGALVMRVAGDLASSFNVRRWGGMLNAVALSVFAVIAIATVVRANVTRRRTAGP